MEVDGQLQAPTAVPPNRNSLRYPSDKRSGGRIAGLDVVVKRKISFLRRESNFCSSVVQFVV
jgi:hypothetical protein